MPDARRLPVAEGVSLHGVVWEPEAVVGAETGGSRRRPFLLVHGLSSNCRTWERVAERLAAAGHAVAAVDLRGHGRSDKPEDGYDFATLTGDLRQAIAGLGFAEPIVVGQSTGGNLAVELASGSSGTVSGAVGIDGGAIDLSARWPLWEDCAAALAPPRFAGTPVTEVEAWIRRAHPDWSDWAIEATLANLEVSADGTVRPWLTFERHMQLLRALWDHRPADIVGRLDVPLLLVHATNNGDQPHAPLAGAMVEAEILPGDHDLHVQQPDAVADRLLRFAP